jgi:hypothetical protein
MQVSKVFANVSAKPVNVGSLADLAKLATTVDYSLGTFNKNYRENANFIQAEAIGLDFDDGMTIDEAKRAFAEYRHIIAPSRSHRKEKKGKVADRFRVILFLTEPIKDIDTYYATWHSIADKFPACDKSCKDPARQYFKSPAVECINDNGKMISPVTPKPKLDVVPKLDPGKTGKLAHSAAHFFLEGAPQGQRHHALYKAARDAFQNGFTKDWVIAQLQNLDKTQGLNVYADAGSLKAVDDAFEKEPKHAPRVTEKAFSFMPIGDLMSRNIDLKWVINYLLTEGGLSIFAGAPKSGKSTLVRQLVKNVCRGEDFLGHKTKQGEIVYLALEEQDAMLKNDFKRLGVTKDDPISIHVGGPLTLNAVQDLEEYLIDKRPLLTIVDTLMDLSQIRNANDYAEVKAAMSRLRKIARDSGTHIICVHHGKKPQDGAPAGGSSILGSTAFFGGVDMALTIDVIGSKERKITTRGRGVKQYDSRPLIFDEKTHTFTLGPNEEEF